MTLPPRLHQITLLLRSLDWYDLQPKSWTPELVRRQSKPGEGPSKRVNCPTCWTPRLEDPVGMVLARQWRGGPLVPTPCTTCGGELDEQGVPTPGRGWVIVDGMTERRVGTIETGLERPMRRVRCDACDEGSVTAGRWRGPNNRCERCGGSGSVEVALMQRVTATLAAARERTGDPVIDAGIRRSEAGSYDELLIGLAALRLDDLDAYRAVSKIDEDDRRTIEQIRYDLRAWRGLCYLEARWMPDPIRVPRAVHIATRHRKAQDRIDKRRGEQAA